MSLIKNWALLTLATILTAAPIAIAKAKTAPGLTCPTDQALSKLVASSDTIVIGVMDVPRKELGVRAKLESPEYLNIPITIDQTIKGRASTHALLRFFPKDAPYKPSNTAMLERSGTRSILFLTQVDDGPVGLYFAGNSPLALRPATAREIAAASAETARQDGLLRIWRPDTSAPHYREVHALLARLGRVRGVAQQQVFDRLEALGSDALPAVISQMDDRRPLGDKTMSLANHSPNAFESVRHYGPELVVDALDAILNQITGESFGFIGNGSSNRQRAATVAAWRVYAAGLVCAPSPSSH